MSNAEITFIGAAIGLIAGVFSALALSAVLRKGPDTTGTQGAAPVALSERVLRLVMIFEPLVLAAVGALIAYWVFGVH